jgi:hypothetical protein
MRRPLATLVGVLLTAVSAPATACSYIFEDTLYFPFNSSDIDGSKGVAGTLNRFKERFGSLKPQCINFRISATTDPQEADLSQGRILRDRANAVARRLAELGFAADRIRIVRLGVVQPPVRQPPEMSMLDRPVTIEHAYSKGRMRCDPATKLEQPGPCGGEYLHCYLELEDGTACNVYNVPDPNPQKYSVTYSDEFKWGGFRDGQWK